jgi:hypothetical protein
MIREKTTARARLTPFALWLRKQVIRYSWTTASGEEKLAGISTLIFLVVRFRVHSVRNERYDSPLLISDLLT